MMLSQLLIQPSELVKLLFMPSVFSGLRKKIMVSTCSLCIWASKDVDHLFLHYSLFLNLDLCLKFIGRCHHHLLLYPILGCGLKPHRNSLPYGVLLYLQLFGVCGGKGTIEFSGIERRLQRRLAIKAKYVAWASSLHEFQS